jgi:glycosyltransferase involved in cell wall biosynthesis
MTDSSSTKYILASVGNWLDIKLADTVIVHNHQQLEMLQKNFGKEGVLVKKPILISDRKAPIKAIPPIVLWVGQTGFRSKQPELFLALAEAIPAVRFQMIGGPGQNTRYSESIKQAAERIPNLDFRGFVPFVQTTKYFSAASLLINTSMFEGYPTHAFLQAWMNYTPVISLGDNSDEMLSRHQIGIHSNTFEQLVDDVKKMLGDETARARIGVNGRNYVEQEYDLSSVIIRYIKLFTYLAT